MKANSPILYEMPVSGAVSITVTVQDMKGTAVVIRTEFPAGEAAPVVEKAIRGCLR